MVEAKCQWNTNLVKVPEVALKGPVDIPVCSGCQHKWCQQHFVKWKEEDIMTATALGETAEFDETHSVSIMRDPSVGAVVILCDCMCKPKLLPPVKKST